jgi:lysophospholipase L1-like esterase
MYRTLRAICIIATILALGSAQGADAPRPTPEQLEDLHLLQGPWKVGTIHRESVLFLKDEGNPSARLLFDASKIIKVERADRTKTYELGKDFELSSDGSTLTLTPNSPVFFHKSSDLFLPKGAKNSIGQRAGHPDQSLLFAQGHVWHDWQVEITYEPKSFSWGGYKPTYLGSKLPNTLVKLKSKQAVTLALSGDSISEGYNASGFTGGKPHMPAYAGLVSAQLAKSYGGPVTMHNRAIAGWSVKQGNDDLDKLLAEKPDLVIIAYGMNDVGYRNPAVYKAGIATMLDRIKAANSKTEVILVSTMLGNPAWHHTAPEWFPKYRDALASLQREGVVMVDLTSVFTKLAERKTHSDITGNGVNHPNDYGHRIYAQAILSTLIED